ncbi:MAG: DUF3109 family protein [Bacteroidales bacterium]|nr:DUF3109 family protein [Bacteroidales bacterium]MDD6731349.1 DUF3109 family protein [Bacteroidales bacterium]
MIIQVGEVILTSEILTEYFCCDLEACKGICCVEGDSGAPLTLDEVGEMENVLDEVWPDLSAQAQSVIDRQGVAYTDAEGDLVTSIVKGRDCVFTCYGTDGCCYCASDKAFREGRTAWDKPISCALYPIREKHFRDGSVGLQYHRWDICRPAVEKGRRLNLKLYQFLKAPLVRRFGQAWYDELCEAAQQLPAE